MPQHSHPHHRQSPTSNAHQTAFTLIEILVCLFVIGLLIALLLPAVQQVREAARATECRSKLHQIDVAIHNYLELHNAFPTDGVGEYSYGVKILAQIEQSRMADEFSSGDKAAIQANISRQLPLFLCPSEITSTEYGYASYALNWGSQIPDFAADDPGNGFRTMGRALSTRDVPDGLSQTALISETILGNQSADPRTRFWFLSPPYAWGDEGRFADDCQAMPGSPSDPFDPFVVGWPFADSCKYYQLLPPNHRSCIVGDSRSHFLEGRNSASRHHGSVHTAFADGSVKTVSSSIDRRVWWAQGSRNGGEAAE